MALLNEVNVGVEITLNAFLKGLEIELMMQTDKKFGDGSLVCKQENFLLSDGGSKKIFSIFIRISHSTWEEKQHLAKQHLLLRKRLLAAFRDTYVKKWKTLVKTSSLFSRVKIRRIFTLKRDFYCDARLENIQKVSKRAKIWQFMTFLENVW